MWVTTSWQGNIFQPTAEQNVPTHWVFLRICYQKWFSTLVLCITTQDFFANTDRHYPERTAIPGALLTSSHKRVLQRGYRLQTTCLQMQFPGKAGSCRVNGKVHLPLWKQGAHTNEENGNSWAWMFPIGTHLLRIHSPVKYSPTIVFKSFWNRYTIGY